MSFHGPSESQALAERMSQQQEVAKLSEDELNAINARMRALDGFFAKRVVARYKIEFQFGKGRSTWKPFAGAMSLFLSGTKLSGGGDEKLYICPKEGCGGVIYPSERMGASVLCRKCEMLWDEQRLVGELLFRLTPRDWAHVALTWFARLEHNADIYCKYHPTDIRYQTAMELARSRGGEHVLKARNNRGLHIYPLRNIIKDTGAGANLYDRFFSFITS